MQSESNLDQYAQQAYQQSQDRQRALDQQAQQAQGQYQQSVTGANTAQANLADFTKNMQSGTDIYAKQLGLANQNAGYNAGDLNQAQAYLTQLTKQNAGLPQSIQANNANYGATAGNVAQQVGGMQNIYAQGIAGANQSTANLLAKQQAGLTGAQAATTAGVQTQDTQRQAYQATAANAATIMQQSQVAMNAIQALAQSNGQLTAEQQQIFAQAKSNYAAAAASYAAASLASAQAEQTLYATSAQKAKDAAAAAAATPKAKAQTSALKTSNDANAAAQKANDAAKAAQGNIFSGWGDLGANLSTGWNQMFGGGNSGNGGRGV